LTHKYVSTVTSRALLGSGCSCCGGRTACKCNSLPSLYPEVAQEWDYSKNDGKPCDYTARSNAFVWWISSDLRTWQQSILSRTDNRLKRHKTRATWLTQWWVFHTSILAEFKIYQLAQDQVWQNLMVHLMVLHTMLSWYLMTLGVRVGQLPWHCWDLLSFHACISPQKDLVCFIIENSPDGKMCFVQPVLCVLKSLWACVVLNTVCSACVTFHCNQWVCSAQCMHRWIWDFVLKIV